jgi:hypothetical protein
MSFENASVTKGRVVFCALRVKTDRTVIIVGLMVGSALASIGVGMFDVKHYFHLQVLLE